jgi:hypothetical protein
VQVDETFVDLELITVPGLGTLAARLRSQATVMRPVERWGTYRFPSGDLQYLRREPDRSLNTKVLVICPVDEIGRNYKGVMSTGVLPKVRIAEPNIFQDS